MTLRRNLCLSCVAAALLTYLSGCATPRPPLPPSAEVPKPVTDLRAYRKGDKVTLLWTVPVKSTDDSNLRHWGPTLICRSFDVAINRCDPVGKLEASQLPLGKSAQQQEQNSHSKSPPSPVTATYTDVLPPKLQQLNATGVVTYAVQSDSPDSHSAGVSNEIQIPTVPTLAPPQDLSASVTPEGVSLTWSGVLPEVQYPGVSYTYRIYRRDVASKQVVLAGELPVALAAQPQFVDSTMEWQKTYDYWIIAMSVVTKAGTSMQVEGENSRAVTVAVIDTFAPAAPNGLQAVASGEGQKPFVDLTWAPNAEPDLAGYNIYRRLEGGDWVKINREIINKTSFRDTDVVPGKAYSYSVSAVDLRANESSRSEETREEVR